MHFFIIYLWVLSFVVIQIHSSPLHLDECEKICSNRFLNLPAKLHENCQAGCQYFYQIDAVQQGDSSETLRKCYMACANNSNDNGRNKSCIIGCDAANTNQQATFKSVSSPTTLGMDTVEEEHEMADFLTLTTEKDYRKEYFEEYAKLQYTSLIQLSIFCFVLIAIVACSVKIIILIYQFKFSTMKYMLDNSAENEMLQRILESSKKKSTKH